MPRPIVKTDALPTLNASALARLRDDIVACRLMPNKWLRVEMLRERYGIGTSPIREALMRLEAEGLVELEQNKGFKVSNVSSEGLADLMRTRIEIEGMPVKEFAEQRGLSSGNAGVRVFRAREALRRAVMSSCGACATSGCKNCTCGETGGCS